MLVLSRKPGDRIHVGPDIVISVLEVTGKLVRIGIDAPQNISILRGEIKEQIEEENKLAASKSGYIERLRELGSGISFKKRNR